MAGPAVSTAHAVWNGDLVHGQGSFRLDSGVGGEVPVTWAARTTRTPGATSPEELDLAREGTSAGGALRASSTPDPRPTPPRPSTGGRIHHRLPQILLFHVEDEKSHRSCTAAVEFNGASKTGIPLPSANDATPKALTHSARPVNTFLSIGFLLLFGFLFFFFWREDCFYSAGVGGKLLPSLRARG